MLMILLFRNSSSIVDRRYSIPIALFERLRYERIVTRKNPYKETRYGL